MTKYIQSIIFFTLFMVIISIILPNKKYKPYIDFVLGLILISIVIAPFTKFFLRGNEEIDFQYKFDLAGSTEDYVAKYEEKQDELINMQFENHLISQITNICQNEYEADVSKIEMELSDNNITKLDIYLENDVNVDNLKNRLSLSYNLSVKHIDIYIR